MNQSLYRFLSTACKYSVNSLVRCESARLAHPNSIGKSTLWVLSQRHLCAEHDHNNPKKKVIDESRDRRVPVDIGLSIEYMKSDAFKETYQNYKIWELFRRNFKGHFSPSVPRIRCVEDGVITTSNPCVVCRDRYLVLHYKNIELLKHFISPHTGYVYPNTIICLCSEQYEQLCVAVSLAKNYGLIDFEVPLREYSYTDYYPKLPVGFVE